MSYNSSMGRNILSRLLLVVIITGMLLGDVSPVRAETIPDQAYISGVVGRAQQHTLSCETRSAVDVAAFWGVNFTENEFLKVLPKSKNPNDGFVGSVDDPWGYIPPASYGVHAAPIAKTLKKMGLKTRKFSNANANDLKEEIAAGKPVIVWVIGQMWPGTPRDYSPSKGETVTVAYHEHTMILTGYNKDYVQVIDSYSGITQSYSWKTFLKSWAVLGNMAVVVDGKKDSANPTPQPTASPAKKNKKTYIVQPGDYLTAIAKKLGLDWRKIAEINHISYPWIIYPGQVLKLK